MAHTYQFSVGTLTLKKENNGSGVQGIGVMTEISVSYDGDPQSFYGGDYRLPLAVEVGNRSGEVSASSSRWSVDDAPITNNYVDITLGFGPNNGGLSGTIESCKLANYSVSSSQNDFVTSEISFTIANPDHLDKGSTPPTWNTNA